MNSKTTGTAAMQALSQNYQFNLSDFALFLSVMKSQIPRCKQRGIKLAALQSSGVFDPRGSRQISMQAWLLGSLLAGIKNLRPGFFAGNGGRRFLVDILILI